MNAITLGLIMGLVFALATVALMMTQPIPDKNTAMRAAFINRFAIGFLAATLMLPMPQWATGLAIGLVLSLPPAIMTKMYAPILGLGVVGGAVCGFVASAVLHM